MFEHLGRTLTVVALAACFGVAACATDYDGNPPGPRGGPGTNWENPPGPAGGPGASPDTTSPGGWTLVGTREARDRVEQDTIVLAGGRSFDHVRICVYRNPVHFRDLDIIFRNGGHQDVAIAARINPGDCSRAIDLDGGQRDIERITMRYEETSARRRTATVRVFAQ